MTPESISRRNFVKWLVSSFCLTPALGIANSHSFAEWSHRATDGRCKALFSAKLPWGAKHLVSAQRGSVFAAIFESNTKAGNYAEAVRWLCIGNEVSPQNFSIQVTDQALYTSDGFRPVEVELSIDEVGAIEIGQQHVRAHTRLVWKEINGKWCLANRDFAGIEAHQLVTEKYDALTEQYVVTKSLMSEDEPYFQQCSSVKALVTLGEYSNGQMLT